MSNLQAMIKPVRLIALIVGFAAIAVAIYRGSDTRRFIAASYHTNGQVVTLNPNAGRATIQFRTTDGTLHHFDARIAQGASLDGTVPVMYLQTPDGVEPRLATGHALWASMWSCIEIALGAMLLAIYGRALIEDPLSVIGFKGWRITR